MAVNDLMMRIQLLTDTGKSTAELNKLSNQLKSLTSQLQSLQRSSLSNLTKDIESLKSAQASLKATNIQTFAKTLDEAKKSFASLNLNTSDIDKLKQGYVNLQQQISKTAQATQQHSEETKKLNDRLKEAKQYTLTSGGTLRNNTLLNAQVDIAKYTDAIKLADTAARTHRQTILDLKKELVEASKVKFTSTDTIDLQKLKAWVNATGRGITVSKDTKSFDSITAFNNELKKQQESFDKTKDKAKSYQETLAKLRLESQRAAIPDLFPNGRNLLGDLDAVRSKITTLNTQGILPLTNSIRTLQAQSNLDRAFKVDPLKAKIAVARAEVQKWVGELNAAKITGNISQYNALTSQIEKNQQKIVNLTLEAAKNNLKIVDGTARQAALELKSLSNKKNELAVYKDQETAIKSIVAAQKQLAQQNVQSVKTKTGGIFDTTSKQNANNSEANVYKSNIAALKQYYAERKAAAQSDSESIKAKIRETQQQLAQGQLTKSQYTAERAALKEVVAEQKKLSEAYQQTLRTQKESLNLSLKAEKVATTSLRNQIKELVLLNTEAARTKSVDLTSKLNTSKSNQSSLVQQIRETNALADAETKRIAVLERLAGASQKQSTGLAIQSTEALIKEVTKRLDDLNVKSEQAKTKLNAIGGRNTNLISVKQQIKEVQQQLADLRSVGNLAPSQAINFSNLRDNLKNLREQQKLLTQISQVEVKTSTGKIELGNLNSELAKLRELRSEMNKIQQFGRGFASGFGFSLTPDQLGFSAFNQVIGALDSLKQKFIEANSQSETLIRGLNAVFGAGQGDVQFDKLIATASRFGLAIHDLSRNYLSLNASAKGTILEGKESEKIFNSLAAAMSVLGADTISTQRAFRSVSQMISKGQVYSEELKGQLAESLPGAVNTFAQSMGKTTQEFLAMVKAGKVGLNELIPFFELIQQQYGSAATASTTYEQATNRLSNAYTILLKGLGDTGIWSSLVSLIDTVGSKIQRIADVIPGIDENFKLFLNSLQSAANKTVISIKYKLGADTNGNQISDTFSSATSSLESINSLFSIEGRIKSFSQALALAGKDIDSLFSLASEGSKKLQTVLSQSDWKIKVQSIDPTAFDGVSEAKINELYNTYVRSSKQANQEIIANESETNAKIDVFRSERLRKNNRDIEIQMKSYQKMNADEMRLWEARGLIDKDEVNTKNLELTKQAVQQEKLLLDIQQRGALALQQQATKQSERLLKSKGVSDSVVKEFNNVRALSNAYEALSKVDTIGAKFGSNLSAEELKNVSKLQLDQLKYAETVAKSADNHALLVAIQNKEVELGQELLDRQTKGVDIARIKSVAERSALDKTLSGLNKTTQAGYQYANAILKGLSYTEQHARLIQEQSAIVIRSTYDQTKAEWDYQSALLNTRKNVSEGTKQRLSAKQANEAIRKSQESLSQASAAASSAEKQQLYEVAKGYLEVAKAKSSDLKGGRGRKAVEEIKAQEDALRSYQEVATKVANENALSILDKTTIRGGKQDFAPLFTELNNQIVELNNERQRLLQQVNSATDEKSKETLKDAADLAGRKILELEKVRGDVVKTYQEAVTTGTAEPLQIKPALSQDSIQSIQSQLDEVKNKLQQSDATTVDLKPSIKLSEVEQQIKEAVSKAQSIADSSPIVIKTISETIQSNPQPEQKVFGTGLDATALFGIQTIQQAFVSADVAASRLNQTIDILQAQSPFNPVVIDDRQSVERIQILQSMIEQMRQQDVSIPVNASALQQLIRLLNEELSKPLKANVTVDSQGALTAAKKAGTEINQQVQQSQQPIQTIINTDSAKKRIAEIRDYGITTVTNHPITVKADVSDAVNTIKSVSQNQSNLLVSMNVDKTQLQESLRQQNVTYEIDKVSLTNTNGVQEEIRRATATGPGLNVPIEGFQVQANTFEDIVREGNAYLALNRMKVSLEAQGLSKEEIDKKINNEIQSVQVPLGFKNDITEARAKLDQIRQELEASGVTNFKFSLDQEGQITLEVNDDKAKSQVDELVARINSRSADLTVNIKYNDPGFNGSGSLSGIRRQYGGFVPGYGGGDQVRALLERGEFVMRKEAVQSIGLSNLMDMNRLGASFKPNNRDKISIPHYQNGGAVGGEMNFNFNVGNQKFRLSGDRDQAIGLAKAIQNLSRTL